jgi:DNA-binding MarR family transcriptional regulator/GNAT superfamily N-acetyltransferase
MPDDGPSPVDSIRAASRRMVRELGFMRPTLAGTDYPASAVHAILAIGSAGSLTAARLGAVLDLEKSSVSRMLRKLVDAGELKESPSKEDGRTKQLVLTAKGRRTRARIDAFGRGQVTNALARLTPAQGDAVGRGLAAYACALENHRLGKASNPVPGPRIERGYRPGAIGRVVEMHASFYARQVGFGQFFESRVAAGLAEFSSRLGESRNALWTALDSERIVGSVAIDGEDLGAGIAHLRWFIVDDGVRGAGLGRALLNEALAFCDRQGFESIHLWTFQGLATARRLYEHAGFALVEERLGRQWGKEVVEQRFVR